LATVNLGYESLSPAIEKGGILLLDFWAAWCGPCRFFAPVFEAASERHPDVTFGKIDTDAEQDLAMELQIQSIPTIMAFRDGVLLFRQPGALQPPQLEDLIGKIKALDMDEVRAEMAKHTHSHDHDHAGHDHSHDHDH
jgi:thioredoxin 1